MDLGVSSFNPSRLCTVGSATSGPLSNSCQPSGLCSVCLRSNVAGFVHDFNVVQSRLNNVVSPVNLNGSCVCFADTNVQAFVQLHHTVVATGQPNFLCARIPVPSKFNIALWRELLQSYEDIIVCDFLEFGWPLGYVLDTLPPCSLRNHRGALDYPVAITQYLRQEVLLGRVAGPFTDVPFSDGFAVSPLNSVEKRDSSERRIIVDLSWPCGSSVNEGIPTDCFLGEPIDLSYPTIDAITDAIVTAGTGCCLYKRDLRQAYRQFPVDPYDYHLLGYSWEGQFYFDTVLTMGLRSAAMACQRSTSAVTWMFSRSGRVLFNYLDDFIGVSEPSCAMSDFLELGSLLSSLGLRESEGKACPPATTVLCLGVQLDTVKLTMSIGPDRLSEIELLLFSWLAKRTAKKVELQSLVGKLVFVSKCVRQSRVFIARILRVLRSVKFNHHHVNLNAEFRKDIRWWCRFLRTYNGVSIISTASWSAPGEVFTTDACLVGCGGICAKEYFHVEFPDFIVSSSLDINSLELLTIVVALKLWCHRWSGLRLTVRCDNEVAVTVLSTGRCKDAFLNACLREICYLSSCYEFEIRAVHIPGRFNDDADLLSRWGSRSDSARNKFLQRVSRDNLVNVPVPDCMFDLNNIY